MNDARHIAIFLPSLSGGGAERAMVDLATGLVELGQQVDIVLALADGPYLQEVDPRVRVIDLGQRRIRRTLPALIRYLRTEKPAALISAMDHANIVALLARDVARTPTRVIVSIRAHLSSLMLAGPRLRWFYLLARLTYRRAESIVAVSEDVASDAARLLALRPREVHVIPNPVITPRLQELARQPVQHPWFAPGSPPVILACGRLESEKDFTTLLMAFAKVYSHVEARLLILGEGSERKALERLSHHLGIASRVAMPGFVSNPFSFMARANLFISSSRYEGSPNALIQALACGCAVIATACPGTPTSLIRESRDHAIVPVGDVGALAHAITLALGSRLHHYRPPSLKHYEQSRSAGLYLRLALPENAESTILAMKTGAP